MNSGHDEGSKYGDSAADFLSSLEWFICKIDGRIYRVANTVQVRGESRKFSTLDEMAMAGTQSAMRLELEDSDQYGIKAFKGATLSFTTNQDLRTDDDERIKSGRMVLEGRSDSLMATLSHIASLRLPLVIHNRCSNNITIIILHSLDLTVSIATRFSMRFIL